MNRYFAVVFLGLMSVILPAQTIKGKIIGVKDGDTVVLLVDNKPVTVRLEHIDCPEKNQPFGMQAKKFASDLCFGRTAEVIGNGKKDRNGRVLGEVFCQNQNLGKALVRSGLAWHFKRYSKNAAYALLETAARERKIGLWKDPDAMAPWLWRKRAKTHRTLKNVRPAA